MSTVGFGWRLFVVAASARAADHRQNKGICMSVDGLSAADTGEARGGRRGVITCNLILGCLHQSTQISLTAAIRAIAVVTYRNVELY